MMGIKFGRKTHITPQNVETFEKRIGYVLPEDYRQFILQHNGASVEPNIFNVPPDNDCAIDRFIPINNIVKEMKFVFDLPKGFFPIAYAECGNYICMDLNKQGPVYFWDHETQEVTKLSSCFNDFISIVEPFDPDTVQLSKDQIISAWIDPEFEKELDEED